MKIRNIGWSSFLLDSGNISIVTDPLALKNSGLSFPKTKADVVLFTERELLRKENVLEEEGLNKKIEKNHRDSVIEISSPGEFEIGGVMIRRDINSDIYVIDESMLRVVYMGLLKDSFNVSLTTDLGDVDVLILPIGNGDQFIGYEKIEKIIRNVDPTILLPCAYKTDGLKVGKDLKSREDFIKHFGFTNVKDESYVSVTPAPEQESKNMEVIFLK